MSNAIVLHADTREQSGKGMSRAIRRNGKIPAIIYGNNHIPIIISIDPKILWLEKKKAGFYTRLFDIIVDNNEKFHCLVRDVQIDIIINSPLHVDFQIINESSKVNVFIPVIFNNYNNSIGIKNGGVLNIVCHSIELNCIANNIPTQIEIDLTKINIGTSIHINDIQLPFGTTAVITEHDFTIASIAMPSVSVIRDEDKIVNNTNT